MTNALRPDPFEERVDGWVLTYVSDVANFDDLVTQLPGVYPTVVATSVDRLLRGERITQEEHRRAMSRARERRVVRPPAFQILPPPHPLDFDWRYGQRAVDALMEEILKSSRKGDTIALLGTPSLYLAALQRDNSRRFVLLDASKATVESLRGSGGEDTVLLRDFFKDGVPNLNATVVVADPPWYEEHVSAFLWAAAMCSCPNASIFVSLPAEGTRPGVPSERRSLGATASMHSLIVSEIQSGRLSYLTPPFEANALRAAGWKGLPDEWRSGDLAILRSSGRPGVRPSQTHGIQLWDERSIGPVRIRVRRGATNRSADPRLRSLVKGDVLDDVSRRHPLRNRANVWTTGNRIYLCPSPSALIAVLDAIIAGSEPSTEVLSTIGREPTGAEEASISTTVRQVRRLVQTEGQELARQGWTHRSQTNQETGS